MLGTYLLLQQDESCAGLPHDLWGRYHQIGVSVGHGAHAGTSFGCVSARPVVLLCVQGLHWVPSQRGTMQR
jgi:hypothetical protein